jgi:hypothetical protein
VNEVIEMTKEDVLAAFERDIQRGDPKVGESTTQDIKKTAKKLITEDRSGVIEALRYWLNLRHIGLTATALAVIADMKNIPELKPDVECLKAEIESGKVFHTSYLDLVELALKKISEGSK